MDMRIEAALGDLHRRFEGIYGERLARLILYGSRARGDASPDADLDILVLLHGSVDPYEEIERCGEMTAEVSLDLGIVVSCVFMSEEEFNQRQGPFIRNVRREGVVA